MTGNVAEWTLTNGDADIISYPQQDNIMSICHQYWYASTYCNKGGSWYDKTPSLYKRVKTAPCYGWIDTSYSSYNPIDYPNCWGVHGFRVVRRKDVVRPTAVCEFKEDFESWPVKTSSEDLTVTTAAGEWKMSSSCYLNEDASIAVSGIKYLESSSTSYLYLPSLKNRLVEVRMKVRNANSYSRTLYLESGNDKDGYISRSISIPEYSDWRVISLCPTADATTYRIGASSSNLYIDDIEIWTVPREAE
jgi:hypothetical protein